MKKYVCSICGNEYDNLTAYMACVSKCGETLIQEQKEEEQKKRLEEVNAGLNRIKEAEKYLAEVKKDFKDKFPKEYELNFEAASCDACKSRDCEKTTVKVGLDEDKNANEKDVSFDTIAVSVVDDGNGKPKINARVNGKKVDNDKISKLFEDPFMNHIAKMLEFQ